MITGYQHNKTVISTPQLQTEVESRSRPPGSSNIVLHLSAPLPRDRVFNCKTQYFQAPSIFNFVVN